MITTIIFFVFLFACFVLYYIRFIVIYAISKEPNPLLQKVTIVESRVRPINYKADFMINDRDLKYRAKAMKLPEHFVVREIAADYICNKVKELIKEDVHNVIFKLVERRDDFNFTHEREGKRFTIFFSIVPEYETKINYNCKLI